MRSVGIFVPILNEKDNIFELVNVLKDFKGRMMDVGIDIQLLFIDNHSGDGSWEELNKQILGMQNCVAIRLCRNLGYQSTLTLSFSLLESDAYAVFQSDLQDPIRALEEMCKLWLEGSSVVLGVATNRAETLMDKIGRKVFVFFFQTTSDLGRFRWFTDFYVLDKSVYGQFKWLRIENQFIRGRILESMPIDTYFTYNRVERKRGHSKFNFPRRYSLALDAILLHANRFVRRLTVYGIFASGLFLSTLVVFFSASNQEISLLVKALAIIGMAQLALLGLLFAFSLEYQKRIYHTIHSQRNITVDDISLWIEEISGSIESEVIRKLKL